jgi:hypothetical protein
MTSEVPVALRHEDVGHHDLRSREAVDRDGFDGALGGHSDAAEVLKPRREDRPSVGVVVNDEQG